MSATRFTIALAFLLSISPLLPAWAQKEETLGPAATQIIKNFESIPASLRTVKGDQLTAVHNLVDRTIKSATSYVSKNKISVANSKVWFVYARLMMINNQRMAQDAKKREGTNFPGAVKWRRDHYKKIRSLLATVEATAKDPELLRKTKHLIAESYFHTGNFEQSVTLYKAYRKEFPNDPEPDQTLCAVITGLMKAGTSSATRVEMARSAAFYDEAIKMSDLFIERYMESEFIPHVLHMKGKAYIESGRSAQALVHFKKYADFHRKAILNQSFSMDGRKFRFSRAIKTDFTRYLDQYEFYLGYLHYTLGNIDKAKHHLAREVEYLSNQPQLMPTSRVFLTRTSSVLQAIENMQGKPTPALDMKGGWIGGEQIDIRNWKGNVTILFFSAYESARYFPFARGLEEMYQEHWHEGARAAWIAFPKGSKDLEGQLKKVANQKKMLNLSYPVAMDLSEGAISTKAFSKSIIGGGNIYILDRQGKVAWYKIDPTERDIAMAHVILKRLLAEPSN